MPIITLTSDWGTSDHYVGVVKGTILKELENVTIVDITHDIPPFDILQASFIIRNSYQSFPRGTVHIVGVDAEADKETPHIALQLDGQFFIGANNGIFSLIFDKKPDKVVELTISNDSEFQTFPTKDIFIKAACHIARGGTLDVIGKEISHISERTLLQPVMEESTIRGSVLYIDHYENVITNIKKSVFKEVGKGRNFTVYFRKEDYNITELSKSYNDVPEGEKLAFFSDTGFLEIAINKGRAASLLGLKPGATIRIEFHDH